MNLDQHSIWSLILTAFGVVLWNTFTKTQRDVEGRAKQAEVDAVKVAIGALQAQNTKQETDLATLQANGAAHNLNTERLASAIERLDSKIDQLSQSLLSNRRASEKPHA